ncbi:hypothetical protein CDEST_03431 [Colletotrichum destructivum]|uniref:Uncharacterized protein n=1 Tax=Colletotrichum destructivum TaxID=34406 RepID=A0AAX4I4V0_9PEZI|nr:hypothetical protein CDEST_03431 [Colletotrichum destructivum]
MGRLDLIFLPETGAFVDFLSVLFAPLRMESRKCFWCTEASSSLNSEGIECAHVKFDFLYSGEYEAELQATAGELGQGENDIDDAPHPLLCSTRASKLAHGMERFDMYGEAAAALCCLAEHFTRRVEFPNMAEELYNTCG